MMTIDAWGIENDEDVSCVDSMMTQASDTTYGVEDDDDDDDLSAISTMALVLTFMSVTMTLALI